MNVIHKEININEISVNILNPRYEPQESEMDEMNLMITEGKLFGLIKDIAQYGLDPSENLIVSYDENTKMYVSEEGNRRLAAIKLLNDPNVTPDFVINRDSFIQSVTAVKSASSYSKIRMIRCVLIKDPELRKHFIELKHTGENEGAGRIPWDTESKYRYDSNPFKSLLIDLLSDMFPDNKKPYNLSTIDQRILTDPDMRSALDMTVDRTTPSIQFSTDNGQDRFRFIVEGLINKEFNVSEFYYKKDRINFINKYFKRATEPENDNQTKAKDTTEGQKDVSRSPRENDRKESNGGTKLDNDSNQDQAGSENGDGKKANTKKQDSPPSRKYPFQGINFAGDHIGISHSLHELHNIKISNFPLASTMLIRTLLECTIQEYIIIKNINIKIKGGKNIKDLSIQSLLDTCTNNGNGNFKAIQKADRIVARIISEAHGKKDHDELNIVTHGNYREPSINALLDIERRWHSAVEIMIGTISGHAN